MTPRQVSLRTARRLAITRQMLAGPRPPATEDGFLEMARRIRCIQLDPTNAVARTQFLVPFSRLGPYDPALLDQILWRDKFLFHYWAHAASLVLTEDYPIHRRQMITWGTGESGWGRRAREWMSANHALRRHILAQLRRKGPLRSRDFDDRSVHSWGSSGWTNDRNVGRMLDFLWAQGKVMVAGRAGAERLWDLAAAWWPDWMPRDHLSAQQAVRLAAPISLRCLGVGTKKHINEHFIRGDYPGLAKTMQSLERKGEIVPVSVEGITKGSWFAHRADLELIDALQMDEWEPRTVLLSPFDNLICDRERTEVLFDFRYRIEIYVPKNQRLYGYYSMPILHGDRLIGRVDPSFDRKSRRLTINSAHAEPTTARSRTVGAAVRGAVEELATWLGATTIEYQNVTFEPWRRSLK
jgi:uncharacterized protein YcaQ